MGAHGTGQGRATGQPRVQRTEQHDAFHQVPVPVLDGTIGNTDIIIRYSMMFDQRLSLPVLDDGWYRLVECWPILAARVRENRETASGLVYQIPSPDGLRRDRAMAAHVAPQLRQFVALDQSHRTVASYWAGREGMRDEQWSRSPFTCRGPDADEERRLSAINGVETFEQLLHSDRPIFTAQATLFRNGTLISLSVSHVIGDGFCIADMLRAWGALASGVQPTPLAEFGLDNFAGIDVDAKPNVPLRYRMLGLREKVRLIANVLYDQRIVRPESTMETRYVFLPSSYMQTMHEEANEYLRKLAGGGTAPQHVSRSDVLLAWLVKNVAAAQKRHHKLTPITIANARGRKVTGIQLRMPNPFVGAAVALPLSSFTAGQFVDMPIGQLAVLVRNDVRTQSAPDNLRDLFHFSIHHNSWRRVKGKDAEMAKKTGSGKLPFFCPPDHRFCGLTDWRALKLSNLDYSGAMLAGEKGPARPKAFNMGMVTPVSVRDRFACLAEVDGSIWLAGTMSGAEWKNKDGFGRFNQLAATKGGSESKL